MSKTATSAADSSRLQQTDVARRVIADLEKFPALLPVVLKGLAVIENENGAAMQLERILQADSVMVARILRLANSAYFGVMTEVRTVSMAVNIIGFRKLGSLLRHILVAGLVELLAQGRPAAVKIRETALAASTASYEFAQLCDFEDPEDLLVAGHLFNIGEMALLWSFPKEYALVLERNKELDQAQQEVFGTDSRKIGRTVLESWRFPSIFREAVERWPDPLSEPDAERRRFLAMVHAGVAVAQAHESQTPPAAFEIPTEILSELDMGEEQPRQVLAHLPEKITAVRAILED